MAPSFAVRGPLCSASPKFNKPQTSSDLSRRLTSVLLALGLAGCVSYVPAPKSLGETADEFAARSVSWSTVAHTCQRLAPSATCDPGNPDRLMMFAMLVENNPDVAVARAHLRSVEAAATAARTPAGPTLTLSSEYAKASSDPSPWLFGAALDIPLDIGGRRSARIVSADLAVNAARYDLVEAIWSARMEMVRALDEISTATAQKALARQLVALQLRRMQALERRVASGEASRAELERARSDLADARRREATATAGHEAGKVRVAKALGLPAANLPVGILEGGALDPGGAASLPTMQQRSEALLARADLLKAMVAYDQTEAELRGEVAKQYPAISVGPGFTWERGLVKLPFNVGLVLPPLDLNRRNIRATEARRNEAGAALEAAYASAVSSVDTAYAEMIAAQRALDDVHKLDLPIAQRLALQADREITAGAIDRTDWAAAQAGLLIARLAERDAVSRVLMANSALEDALRLPLSGPETRIEGISR